MDCNLLIRTGSILYTFALSLQWQWWCEFWTGYSEWPLFRRFVSTVTIT